MHRRAALDGVEHAVDRRRREAPFFRVAGEIGLVDLDHLGIAMGDLLGEHAGDGVG